MKNSTTIWFSKFKRVEDWRMYFVRRTSIMDAMKLQSNTSSGRRRHCDIDRSSTESKSASLARAAWMLFFVQNLNLWYYDWYLYRIWKHHWRLDRKLIWLNLNVEFKNKNALRLKSRNLSPVASMMRASEKSYCSPSSPRLDSVNFGKTILQSVN